MFGKSNKHGRIRTTEMTRRNVQMVEDDLGEAHKEYGPIDRFLR